jgi:hypothetical protein
MSAAPSSARFRVDRAPATRFAPTSFEHGALGENDQAPTLSTLQARLISPLAGEMSGRTEKLWGGGEGCGILVAVATQRMECPYAAE